MITIFNTPSDEQWIFDLKERFRVMKQEQRDIAYTKAKARQDIISFSMAGCFFMGLYLSGDRFATNLVGMILFFAFMIFVMPQRKKTTLEICILELIDKEKSNSIEE